MAGQGFVKIAFELQQDQDGYPPVPCETLWAVALEEHGNYQIDNIPLYIKGISSEDSVLAESQQGQLQFVQLLHASANSVVRVYVAEESDVQAARQGFRALGCESEQSSVPRMFAMEIPGSTAMEPVQVLLEEGAVSGRWEYEVGALRHRIAGEV